MNFCKDCAHFDKRGGGYCTHPKLGFDPVNGTPKTFLAHHARIWGHMCGNDGLWFKQKPFVKEVTKETSAWKWLFWKI